MVTARQQHTQVTILGSGSIFCEEPSCQMAAAFLFRTGHGRIAAYCDRHAREKAAQLDITLPEQPLKVRTAGG